MRRKRVDANQKQITKELRDLGFSVALTHTIGKGFPDIVVGKNGVTLLVELKANKKAKLTPDEKAFLENWQGSFLVATSTLEIVKWFEEK
jgi:Holliday junction resolvase